MTPYKIIVGERNQGASIYFIFNEEGFYLKFSFCLQIRNGQNKNETKKKQKTMNKVKEELIKSSVRGKEYESDRLSSTAKDVQKVIGTLYRS